MLLAREPETLERMRHLSLQGRVPGTLEYEHDSLGYNYTLSNVSAAVGLAQLERLDSSSRTAATWPSATARPSRAPRSRSAPRSPRRARTTG